MSHHKKPIKASIPDSQLFVSHGFFNTHPLGQSTDSLPWRPMLYHPFTSQINLLLAPPAPLEKMPDFLQRLSLLGAFQYLTHFNLADLLDVNFAQTYLRLGSLVALSVSKVMGDDVFAIDGHGTIHLRLNQSTYQTLGIPGRRSKFGPPGQHFVVEIDMRDQMMRSGKPIYERTRKCLDNFPISIYGDLLGPENEFKKGRRWDVVMSWVDEKGSLQPIQPSTTTTVKTCFPVINHIEKVIPHISQPDITNCSVEDLLDLYELAGEAILLTELTEERHQSKGGRMSATTIGATGFFHPFKLAELTQTLVKSYSIISITAHTAQFSPFSFLVNRMTISPRVTNNQAHPRDHQKKKKKKKGKSVMTGPERGINAGPTSLTMIAFNDDLIITNNGDTKQNSSENYIKESSDIRLQSLPLDQSLHSTDSISTNSAKRIKIDDTITSDLKVSSSSSTCKKNLWLIFESVGNHDTHC